MCLIMSEYICVYFYIKEQTWDSHSPTSSSEGTVSLTLCHILPSPSYSPKDRILSHNNIDFLKPKPGCVTI